MFSPSYLFLLLETIFSDFFIHAMKDFMVFC